MTTVGGVDVQRLPKWKRRMMQNARARAVFLFSFALLGQFSGFHALILLGLFLRFARAREASAYKRGWPIVAPLRTCP